MAFGCCVATREVLSSLVVQSGVRLVDDNQSILNVPKSFFFVPKGDHTLTTFELLELIVFSG